MYKNRKRILENPKRYISITWCTALVREKLKKRIHLKIEFHVEESSENVEEFQTMDQYHSRNESSTRSQKINPMN